MSHKLFITCLPGFEEILAKEVQQLLYEPTLGKGGVHVVVPALRDAMLCNLHLRTASRVLLHLCDITNPTKYRLYQALYERDWRPYFKTFPTFSIEVPFSTHPDFTNTLYAAQLAKDAICDQLTKATGRRPSVDTKNPHVRFSLVIDEHLASFAFDTSNEPLFKRGYRPESVEAPLKETLAAALLYTAGYDPKTMVLLDPCCGGGTFLVEAGLMATNTAPGLMRSGFGFARHPEFDEAEWKQVRSAALEQVVSMPSGRIFGCERDAKSYRLLLRSVARAGLMSEVKVMHTDFRDAPIPELPNFVIANPPFGVRLGEAKRWESLYRSLGALLKQKTRKPAVGGILTVEPLVKTIGLKAKEKIPVLHGGLNCVFCIFAT